MWKREEDGDRSSADGWGMAETLVHLEPGSKVSLSHTAEIVMQMRVGYKTVAAGACACVYEGERSPPDGISPVLVCTHTYAATLRVRGERRARCGNDSGGLW